MKSLVFYSVYAGFTPGIYLDWELAREQTEGYPGALYRKFSSIDDALEFVLTGIDPTDPGKGRRGGGVEDHLVLPATPEFARVVVALDRDGYDVPPATLRRARRILR